MSIQKNKQIKRKAFLKVPSFAEYYESQKDYAPYRADLHGLYETMLALGMFGVEVIVHGKYGGSDTYSYSYMSDYGVPDIFVTSEKLLSFMSAEVSNAVEDILK